MVSRFAFSTLIRNAIAVPETVRTKPDTRSILTMRSQSLNFLHGTYLTCKQERASKVVTLQHSSSMVPRLTRSKRMFPQVQKDGPHHSTTSTSALQLPRTPVSRSQQQRSASANLISEASPPSPPKQIKSLGPTPFEMRPGDTFFDHYLRYSG